MARRELDPARYLADYVTTFVEKDVAASGGVERLLEFHRVIRLLAARTGTILDATDIGQLVGIKGQTVSGWLDFLVEAQGRQGTRWFGIEAKLGIQGLRPIELPDSLARAVPELREVWVVTPGGGEKVLSRSCRQLPITALAARLEEALTG